MDYERKKFILKKSKAWISKSNKTKDEFDKFISLFISFNIFYNLYVKTKREDIRRERERALRVRDLLKINKANLRLIRNFYNCVKSFRLERRNGSDLLNLLNQRLNSYINDSDEEGLLKISLECLYQIRCNLLHGLKEPIEEQRGIMMVSFNLLKSFLDMAIKKYEKKYLFE